MMLADKAWDDIPLVKLAGLGLGLAIMWLAIRSIFGKK